MPTRPHGAPRMTAVTVGILRERAAGERRVAATPETVRKLVARGAQVGIEAGAGAGAGFVDEAYVQAGAVLADATSIIAGSDVLLAVQSPPDDVLTALRPGTTVVGLIAPQASETRASLIRDRGLVAFPLERLPR